MDLTDPPPQPDKRSGASLPRQRHVQFSVRCKDCDEVFTYSEQYAERMRALGQSPPERCERHRATHAREIRSVGLSHFRLRPKGSGGSVVVQSAGLGQLNHSPRVRLPSTIESDPSGMDVGITDEDVRSFFAEMARDGVRVAIV